MSRWVLVLPWLVGCQYGSAFSAAETMAQARCDRAFACATAYPDDRQVAFATLWGADVPDCEARIGPDPAFEADYKSAEKGDELVYDKAAAKACVGEIPLPTCEEFWASAEPEACALVFQGTVPLDGPCTIDAVCETGLCDGGRCVGQPEED